MDGVCFWVAAINKAPPKLFFKLYWITFLLFIVHRAKEKVTGIFEAISNFAGITKPETTLMLAFALIVLSVGSWAIAPLLIKKEYIFGYYFAWTFLAYASISELVHLVFVGGRGAEGFFGVFGAALLAPVACWGMFKLSQKNN